MPKRKHTKAAAPRVDKRKGGRMPPLSKAQKDFVHTLHTGTITQAELDAADPLYAWTPARDERVRQYFGENPRTALKNIATALGFPFHVVKQRARKLGLLATVRTREALCAHGQPTGENGKAPGYDGPDHCAACHEAVNQAVQRFDEGVGRGEHDAEGYTAAERTAATKRAKTRRDPASASSTDSGGEQPSPTAESDRPASDPVAPPLDDTPRLTVACPHGDTRLVIARHGTNGFAILEGPAEVSYGVGFHGLPICPTHQVEMITGEPIPVSEAMRLVIDVTEPQQAKLFDTTKPFNFEGAWMVIESMEDEIDQLTERLEKKLTEVKYLRKQITVKQALHKTARLEFKARRIEKATQIIAAEVAAEAREDAAKGESAPPAPLVEPDASGAAQAASL